MLCHETLERDKSPSHRELADQGGTMHGHSGDRVTNTAVRVHPGAWDRGRGRKVAFMEYLLVPDPKVITLLTWPSEPIIVRVEGPSC